MIDPAWKELQAHIASFRDTTKERTMNLDNIPTMQLTEMFCEHMAFVDKALTFDDRTDSQQMGIIMDEGRRLKAKTEKILQAAKK